VTGATGATGIGATGPTGPAGSSGAAAGHIEYFLATTNVKKNTTVCIDNAVFGTGQGPCPAATSGYTTDSALAGPITASGGTASNLQAFTDVVPTGTANVVIRVIDNTTGVTKLTCTINAASSPASSCRDTSSAPVAAGDYLEVQVTTSNDNVVNDSHYRVSFRD
jgi:hypothetical protein